LLNIISAVYFDSIDFSQNELLQNTPIKQGRNSSR